MRRRRFLATTASAMAVAPFVGLAGCGNGSSHGGSGPDPVPESDVVLRLPQDMYQHLGSPTEWWWHTGTLRSGDRVFGFEINAASFVGNGGFAFNQIMLTDVATGRHYKRTTPFVPFDVEHWAQSDPSQDWYARLGDPASALSAIEVVDPGSGYTADPTVEISGGGGSGAIAITRRDANGGVAAVLLIAAGSGYTSPPAVTIRSKDGNGGGAVARAFHSFVTMDAPASDPTQNMRVRALLDDDPTHQQVRFDLLLSQQGRPFFVWGTGITPGSDPSGGTAKNNYYFSLTRLAASGTIEFAGERFEVEGVTWMDHEYGTFGSTTEPVKWILQDMQLDNGVCISNYLTNEGDVPDIGERKQSLATVQEADGTTYFVETFLTPVGRTWTSEETGATYFLEFRVEIPSFDADLHVVSLVDSQEFPVGASSVYEGVAEATGTFRGKRVRGTAWNEQEL